MQTTPKAVIHAEERAEAALFKAAEALNTLYLKSRDSGLPGVRGADDGRLLLAENICEFAYFLQGRRDARGRQS